MKRGLLIFLAIIGGVFSMFSAELRKAEVISDGDRGLALEWVKEIDGGIEAMTSDENGNIFILGYLLGNLDDDYLNSQKQTFFLCEYSPSGELNWIKTIYTELYHELYPIRKLIYDNGRLYFHIGTIDQDVYYEGEKIRTKNGGTEVLYCIVDASTGELIKCEKINAFADHYSLNFFIGDNEEKYIAGVISDGEYWEDGYGDPFPKFEGMNQGKYKTNVRTHGKTDYYFAKLDKEDNLVWDFALGGEGADSNGYFGSMDFSINGDTMFVYLCYMSDSLDIDPDPDHEVWIHGLNYLTGRDKLGIVLIQYNTSGDIPKLMSYKQYDWSRFIDKDIVRSHPQKGTYMAVENPDFRIVRNGYIYKKSGEAYLYAQVDDQCNITVVDSIPPSNGLNTIGSIIIYVYDDSSNLYVTNSRVLSASVDTLPIKLNFTKDKKEYVFDDLRTWYTCVSKFGSEGDYNWSLVLKNVDSYACVFSSEGFVAFKTSTWVRDGSFVTDYDPDPNKQYIADYTKTVFPKYRETYRIAAEPSDHGEVIVPDTFAWHGKDYEIEVHPNEGYKTRSVTVNGKEILADGDGKYYVKNVIEPICVEAQFSEKSAIQDYKINNFEINPNIVEHYIELSDIDGFASYKIVDMNGKIIRDERVSAIIDVEKLKPGRYQILLRGDKGEKVGTFVKR